MSFNLDQNNLIQYLNKNQLNPVFQKESGQIYISLKKDSLEVLLFFVISSHSQLLQLVAYLPYQLHETTIPDVARMLHVLNKELDMPGFGMDEKEKLLFYRAVIPCLDTKVDERLLRTHIGTIELACHSFMHAIGMISSGTTTLHDFLKKESK